MIIGDNAFLTRGVYINIHIEKSNLCLYTTKTYSRDLSHTFLLQMMTLYVKTRVIALQENTSGYSCIINTSSLQIQI